MSVVIGFTDIMAQLKTDDRETLDIADKLLSYYPEGARFTDKFKKGFWSGKISFLRKPQLYFSAGFVRMLITALEKKGHKVELLDQRKPIDMGKAIGMYWPDEKIKTCLLGIELRDYQVAAIQAFLKARRGVIEAPTGAGKTACSAGIVKCLSGYRQLFLTHRAPLVAQTYKRFQAYFGGGIRVAKMGARNWKEAQVVIGTVQTFEHAFRTQKKKGGGFLNPERAAELKSFLSGIEVLIVDEVHRAASASFQNTIQYMENTVFRLGLSATPYKGGKEEKLKVMSVIGPVIHMTDKESRIEAGELARPLIKFVSVKKPRIPKGFNWERAYRWGIVKHPTRNAMVVAEAIALATRGEKVLILVVHIEHGQILVDLFKDRGIKSVFVHGGTDDETRDKVTEAFEGKGLNIVVMSTIADEGMDIPIISAVVLGGGWRSPVRFIQRIGRGMRPSGEFLKVVDFADFTHPMLLRHSIARFKLAMREEGYKLVGEFGDGTETHSELEAR
jgi:superfamily II DNA or RNA helicase